MVKVTAEIGLNHNGSFKQAIRLQEAAAACGCWAVKYQIRTAFKACSPAHLWNTTRQWQGETIGYLEYRRRLEFNDAQLSELRQHAKSLGLEWYASPWDVPSAYRLASIQRDYCKVASAAVTQPALLEAVASHRFGHLFLSTGMSTFAEVAAAADALGATRLTLLHAVSLYPCQPANCHLRRLETLRRMRGVASVGYSGHEAGILPSLYAAALGAEYIERHFTLDKTAEGSDHKASLEPAEMLELCARLAEVESILGSPTIEPLPEESESIKRLRPAEVRS